MEFRTTIKPADHQGRVNHSTPIMLVGSCFSDNIGRRLENDMFDVEVNPFGTLYNPASISSALSDIIACREFGETDLFQYEGRYHSFSHHSRFSGTDARHVLDVINRSMAAAHEQLQRCRMLLVTFGTARVFRLKSTGQVVSNCHKLPSSMFDRERMEVDEIITLWTPLLEKLKSFNPLLDVVFTVSPIRHLADGLHGNTLSKATLHLAVDRLAADYFPAYEALMDDLRDYRFYASDMTHPSDVAADYVYQLFCDTYMDRDTQALATRCRKISQRLQHRPMTDDAAAIGRFNTATRHMTAELLKEYPCLERAINKQIQK